MGVLLLREREIEQLLDMPTAVQLIERAFCEWADGQVENVPRARARMPGLVLHTMSAAAAYLGLAACKTYTTTSLGARFDLSLYDHPSGQLLAVMEANRLGQMRTGATTGVAVSRLTSPQLDRVGVLGTGWQAQSQVEAVAAVRRLREVVVYSRNSTKRGAFASRLAQRLEIPVRIATEASAAVRDMPLVITATNSSTPVLQGDWLASGALVCAIGVNWPQRAELDVRTLQRATHIVCDSIPACRSEAGDLLLAEQAGAFDWAKAVELAQIVSGKTQIQCDSGVVVFKSVGLAIEDLALASELRRRALENVVGTELLW